MIRQFALKALSLKAPATISVAMCTCNGERYIEPMLLSILDQEVVPLEIVVYDDASDDDTVSIVSRVAKESSVPIRVFCNPERVGVVANFERAITECEGDFIALADQDDFWYPSRLANVHTEIRRNSSSELALYFSDLDLIDEEGKSLGKTFFDLRKLGRIRVDGWKRLAVRNYYPGCSLVFDKRMLEVALPFPEDVIMHDWWIMFLFLLIGKTVQLEPTTMAYRVHSGNAMGVRSFRKTAGTVLEKGVIKSGIDNVSAVVRQCEAAMARIENAGLDAPVQLKNYVNCFGLHPIFRLVPLARTGIFSDIPRAGFPNFIFSLSASRESIDDSTRRYG